MMPVEINSHNPGTVKPMGGTLTITKLGGMTLTISGIGQAAFIDLGDKKLPDYPMPSETWGMVL